MKKLLFLIVLVMALVLARNILIKKALETSINFFGKAWLAQPLQIREVNLNRQLQLQLRNLSLSVKTADGKTLPLKADSITPDLAGWRLFSREGYALDFSGLKILDTGHGGGTLTGAFRIRSKQPSMFDVQAMSDGFNLRDLTWLNPDLLSGSSGKLYGPFHLRASKEDFLLTSDLKIPQGKLQARFFSLLTPYLPQTLEKARLESLSTSAGLVVYKNAEMRLDAVQSDKIKVFLHIQIPDYNLNLNLNLDLRLDKKNAFSDLSELMGMVKGNP